MAGSQRAVALLGDVVASRRHAEPDVRRERVGAALSLANERLQSIQPLTPTIGDEFQGLFTEVVSALEATLVVRLAVLGEVDVRFGIGSGRLVTFEASRAPFDQDGPAWWSAREAVDHVRELSQRHESP